MPASLFRTPRVELKAKLGGSSQGMAVTMFGDPVRLDRTSYRYLLSDPNAEIRGQARQHQEGIGYFWSGVAVGVPYVPRSPNLPHSSAISFLRQMYNCTLMGLNDDGKIMLD